jgi:hypothetical protein
LPKAQQKGKLEEIPPEDLSTNIEDLKPRESKPQTTLIKSKPKKKVSTGTSCETQEPLR